MALSAGWALQRALYQTLVMAPSVLSALGGAHVFDRVPRHQARPFLVLDGTDERDWSTGTEAGSEHFLSLRIEVSTPGRRQLQAVVDAVRQTLRGTQPPLQDHVLVGLSFLSTVIRRSKDDDGYVAVMTFRATTEPA